VAQRGGWPAAFGLLAFVTAMSVAACILCCAVPTDTIVSTEEQTHAR